MKVNTSDGITVLTASEGNFLTDGRHVAPRIRLREGDTPDNWREITHEEAVAMHEARRAEAERRRAEAEKRRAEILARRGAKAE